MNIFGNVFREAWKVYVPNLGVLALGTIIMEAGYLILLKFTFVGGELYRPFILAGMYKLIFEKNKQDLDSLFFAFKDKKIAINILLYGVILIIGTSIGLILLILPGIYFFIATIYTIPFIVRENIEVIDAIKKSLKLFNENFLISLLIIAIIFLINIFAVVPYGLLSLFTVPFSVCLIGKLFELLLHSPDN